MYMWIGLVRLREMRRSGLRGDKFYRDWAWVLGMSCWGDLAAVFCACTANRRLRGAISHADIR